MDVDMKHHRHRDEDHITGQGHGGMSQSVEHMGMEHTKLAFEWAKTGVPVFFKQWSTATIPGLVLGMLTAVALGAGYEVLRYWLSRWDNTHRGMRDLPWWKRLYFRCFRSVVHALSAAVGYLQMLLAMTYDIRIFVCIILGCGIGFFFLGPYIRRLAANRKRNNMSSGVVLEFAVSADKDGEGQGVGDEEQRLIGDNGDIQLLPVTCHHRQQSEVGPVPERAALVSNPSPVA